MIPSILVWTNSADTLYYSNNSVFYFSSPLSSSSFKIIHSNFTHITNHVIFTTIMWGRQNRYYCSYFAAEKTKADKEMLHKKLAYNRFFDHEYKIFSNWGKGKIGTYRSKETGDWFRKCQDHLGDSPGKGPP